MRLPWKQQWNTPPKTFEEYRVWKIYCRIWKDVGLVAPGHWIHYWLTHNVEEELEFGEKSRMTDSINHYVNECRE